MELLKNLWASKAVKSAVISLAGAVLTVTAAYVGAMDWANAAMVQAFLTWASARLVDLIPKDA
jgi:hypothetical protein